MVALGAGRRLPGVMEFSEGLERSLALVLVLEAAAAAARAAPVAPVGCR